MNLNLIYALTQILVSLLFSQAHSKHHYSNNGPVTTVTKHLSFPNFSSTLDSIKLLGSSKLSENNTLEIPDQSQQHRAGRALYSSPVRLFDPSTTTPASFETTFSFRFSRGGGSGLAFILAPDEFTVGRAGPWLAMINDACDDEYKTVAVEFDTRFNPEFGDPNDNHVGVDLGSMVSTRAVNASSVGINLNDGEIHRAWIAYDGPNRSIEIKLGSDSHNPPTEPVFSGPLDISPYLKEYMFVGFSASTGNATQIHTILSWEFKSTSQAFLRVPSSKTCESKIVVGKMTRTEAPSSFLIFIGSVGLATAAVVLGLYCNALRRRRSEKSAMDKSRRPIPPNKPRKFTLTELSVATSGFGETEIMGTDSRGSFYRGKLSNSSHVAVKRFSPGFLSTIAPDGAKRLIKEATEVGRLRHPNLVPIRGWCRDARKNEALVVYEFFPNGSLDKWLFGAGVLPWTRRFKVVKDVAEALTFLHSSNSAHKNLKTSSVLLDASFRACAGDFGFVLCGAESRRFEAAVSQSADVFEFGLLVLEIVAGKRRSDEAGLLDLGWMLHEECEKVKFVDKRMGKVLNLEQVIRVLDIGLLCTLNESKGRPQMEEVTELLSSERPVPELPPCRPVSLFPYSSMNVGLCTGYSCSFK